MAALSIVAAAGRTAIAAQVWFSPGDDLDVKGIVSHPDFQGLFQPDAPWPTGMRHVDVMQVRPPWFLRMPDSAIKQLTGFLATQRIALASQLGGVQSETCGQGVEGIMSARGLDVYPREMRRKGVRADYAVLDEPLFFGHDYRGKNACNFSIAETAHRLAIGVGIVRKYYPNIRFVLVEPPQSLPGGAEELREFLDDYKIELNTQPLAVRFDVRWQLDWQGVLPIFIQMLKARGLDYGIIYDATQVGVIRNDAVWVASAEKNVVAFEAISDRPGEAVIQSWNPNPVRILPESDPTTTTGFLKWYVDHRR